MTRTRRLLSALAGPAVLVAIAALVWTALLRPAQVWQTQSLQARTDAMQGIERLTRNIAALQAERAGLSDDGALGTVWTAQQMGEATARIQSSLSALAAARGVSLRSVSPTSQRDLSLANAAGFRLELEAGLDQLTGFLTDIEYHTPVLLVERASLRRLNKAGSGQRTQPLVFAQIDLLAPVTLQQGGQP